MLEYPAVGIETPITPGSRISTRLDPLDSGPPTPESPDPAPHLVLLHGLIVEVAVGVAACAVGALLGHRPERLLFATWPALAAGAAAALPMLALLPLVTRWRVGPFERIQALLRSVVVPLFRGVSTTGLAAISVAAGVGEELFFRGLIQAGLEPLVGPIPAIALSSLVFGLAHPLTPAYALIVTLVGAYLGTLLWCTGNLLVPVVAHALYDFLALLWILRLDPATRSRNPSFDDDHSPP